MKHSESSLQQACVRFFRLQYPDRMIYAIPNGGHRNRVTGAILKNEGTLAGIPDLHIPESNGNYLTLYIEMKVGYNKPSEAQTRVIKMLEDRGHYVAICYTFEEFEKVVKTYFGR